MVPAARSRRLHGGRARALVWIVLLAAAQTASAGPAGSPDPRARAWRLVEGLQEQPREVTRLRLEELRRLGEDAAPALISLLRDDCSSLSTRAGIVLEALGARSMSYYVAALADENPRVRSAAALRLSLVGVLTRDGQRRALARRAIPALIGRLDDDDLAVAEHAGGALANLLEPSDGQWAAPLAAALRRQAARYAELDGEAQVMFHHEPAHALAALGAPGLAALREALSETRRETREAALAGLGRMGPEAAPAARDVAAVIREELARHRSHGTGDEGALRGDGSRAEMSFILFEAGKALGAMGPGAAAAMPALTAWLGDAGMPGRWQAAAALGRIGPLSAPAVPTLLAALADEEIDHHVAGALARIGPVALPGLLDALGDESTRDAAVRALGLMGDAAGEAGPRLLELFEMAEGPGSCEVAGALWRIGYGAERVLPALADDCDAFIHRESLRHPGSGAASAARDLWQRQVAEPANPHYAQALAQLGDVVISDLVAGLGSRNGNLRAQSAWILERSEGDIVPALPALVALLGDPERRVRRPAGHALFRAGPAVAPFMSDVVSALADEEDPYLQAVLMRILRQAPAAAAPAEPLLEKIREQADLTTSILAEGTLQAVRDAGREAAQTP